MTNSEFQSQIITLATLHLISDIYGDGEKLEYTSSTILPSEINFKFDKDGNHKMQLIT
jgi:hypothetical protein